DAPSLARALIALLADPRRAASLGEAGRNRVIRDFGEERLVDRMEEIFRDVTGAGGTSGRARA
ncbi:MAG TPA: hypothetical protein VLA43_20900, partial [Longimicrobiales bacterium]|nr:hypothetical protein [Longimicrobiales bacterium]